MQARSNPVWYRLLGSTVLAGALPACPTPPLSAPPRQPSESPAVQVEVQEEPPAPELVQRAGAALAAGQLAQARAAVERLLRSHPNHLEGRVVQAMLLEDQGDRDGARGAWDSVERVLVYRGKRGPFELKSALAAATAHYVARDKPRRSRLFLDELWRRFPTDQVAVQAQMSVARAAFERERWPRVIAACKVLSRLRPGLSETEHCATLAQAARRMLAVGPEPDRTAGEWRWEHPLPQGNTLLGAWTAPDGELWAVGRAGTIVHRGRRGGRLEEVRSPTRWDLRAVSGSGSDNVVAVGAGGVVVRHDGRSWTVARPPTPRAPDLWAVTTAGPTQVVAVGERGVVVELSEGQWRSARVAQATLRGVWGSSADDLVAVGDGGILLRRQGGKWQAVRSDTYEDLWAVWGVSAGGCVAVGNRKTVVRFDGERAEEDVVGIHHFRGVWGPGRARQWAVGTRGEIIQIGRKGWRATPSGTLADLYAVTGSSPRSAWAVGEGGAVVRLAGSRWRRVAGGTQERLVAVVTGERRGEAQALGEKGLVLRRHNGRWRPGGTLPMLGRYTDMWSDGKRSVAVGRRGLMVVREGQQWRRVETDTPEDLTAVWGVGEVVVAVGTRGTAVRLVGGRVVRDRLPTGLDLHGVWGRAADDLVAVGNRGTLLRFDGTAWTQRPTRTLDDLRAVQGVGEDGLIVVGEAGTVLALSGGQVTRQESPLYQTLVDVWAAAPDRVVAISREGGAIRYDGTSWRVQRSPASCLEAVGGDERGALAVGCYGSVLSWSMSRSSVASR